jgi:hypothetical protein
VLRARPSRPRLDLPIIDSKGSSNGGVGIAQLVQ